MANILQKGVVGLAALVSVLMPNVSLPAGQYTKGEAYDQSAAIPYQTVDETLVGTSFRTVCTTELDEQIKASQKPLMVFFYSNRGKGSITLATIFKEVTPELGNDVVLLMYNVDCDPVLRQQNYTPLLQKYQTDIIPYTAFYKNGKKLKHYIRGAPETITKEKITSVWLPWLKKTLSEVLLS